MDKITNQKFKTKFVSALLSGKYKKVQGTMYMSSKEARESNDERLGNDGKKSIGAGFCLMGVAGACVGMTRKELAEHGELPEHILRKIGMTSGTQSALIQMNDHTNKTFKELGCYIQKNL